MVLTRLHPVSLGPRYRFGMTIRRAGAAPVIEVSGLVDRSRTLDESRLRGDARPGADRSGLAVDLSSVLVGIAVDPNASHVTVVSDDGLYSASIPLADALGRGKLLLGAEGTMSRDRGGPFRLVVEDGATLCWNVKSVGTLRFTDGPEPDSVPENPPH